MIRLLTNVSNSAITLTDLNGKILNPNESFDGFASFGLEKIRSSESLAIHILNGNISLYNGYETYTKMTALDILKAVPRHITKDGRPIVATTAKPIDLYNTFSGVGDDLTNGIVGGGTNFEMEVAPGTTGVLNMRYLEDVWVMSGSMVYSDAAFGSYFDLYVVAPLGTPYPHPTKQGDIDWDGTQWIPNTVGTGEYTVSSTHDVGFLRVAAKKSIYGNRREEIRSADPHLLYTPYYMKLLLTVPSNATVNCKALVTAEVYRKTTMAGTIQFDP